jgi:hypothetical protein
VKNPLIGKVTESNLFTRAILALSFGLGKREQLRIVPCTNKENDFQVNGRSLSNGTTGVIYP